MNLLVSAVIYGLIQGLIFVLNSMFSHMLGGRPYYLMR